MNQSEILMLVNQTVGECKFMFSNYGWVPEGWEVVVKTSFSPRRRRSWGGARKGQPFISLALSRFDGTTHATFYEYPSFASSAVIGSVRNDTHKAVKALVVHEMCHAAQYHALMNQSTNRLAASVAADANDTKGHGSLWKNMYKIARESLVNYVHHVPSATVQPVVKQEVAVKKMSGRSEALSWIKVQREKGVGNRAIIDQLVNDYGFKRTTATTYTYTK